MAPENAQVMSQQVAGVGTVLGDIETPGEIVGDVVRPRTALDGLPVEHPCPSGRRAVDIAAVQIPVQDAATLVRAPLEKSLQTGQDPSRVVELRRDN